MTQKHEHGNLRQMVYAESEIGAYDTIASSVKTDDFNFGDNRSVTSGDNRSVTDHTDSHSVVSYATSVYSEMTIEHEKKMVKKQKHKQFQKIQPQTNQKEANAKFNQFELNKKHSNGTFTKYQTTPNMQPNSNDGGGGGLAKKLKTHYKIRESMELDLNASMQSVGSSGVPAARLSEIAKKSVITLRMISINPSKQIRIKLFLPMSSNPNSNEKPQIIVLFVNKGSTMGVCKCFVEDNYPNKVLKAKIKQLCIADDDGDIDEDFPPINDNQDITTLGIQNFWVDRIFEDKRKPSIIYSERAMMVRSEDKHKDTIKERLISQDNNNNNNNNNDDDDDDDEYDDDEDQPKKCCWCCFSRNNNYDNDDDENDNDDEEEDSLEYSQYQELVLNSGDKKDDYRPPNNTNSDEYHSESTGGGGVRFASL